MVITPDEFPWEWFSKIKIQKRKSGNPGSRRRFKYLDVITAFDIETTRLEDVEQSIMYIWQWQFGPDYTVIGRTWDEFLAFVKELCAQMKDGVYLMTFVHNLSYEAQFLEGIYPFRKDEMFCLRARKILKLTMFDHIEMRCSYLHSNMNLDTYCKKMGCKFKKLDGSKFDYTKRRFPWTPLTEYELNYCINDVRGLVEAVGIEMEHDGDSFYTFPLTSTGYVRRDAKAAMRQVSFPYIKNQLPDYEIFVMLREAFRGGDTHANRYYSGIVLHDVKSADRSSSYPDVQCNCEFPVSRFYHAGDLTLDEVCDLINRRHRAVLMRCAFTNIRLRNVQWGDPYISRDKCRKLTEPVYDNGRVLQAEYLETTVTDVDFRILLDEYEWDDMRAFDVFHARYGKLPLPLIRETIKYYRAKTSLKGVAGEELYYLKSKNKLNSIYGMMAQNPVKEEVEYIDGEYIEADADPRELLDKHNRRAFLSYAWGCWVTAWARFRLFEGVKLAHQEGAYFIYCDTDSVKYLGEIDWDKYNAVRMKDSTQSGAHATDPKGNEHYMGVYEREADMCEFCTLGAKKYCFRETPDSPLQVTVSGVGKKAGAKELEAAGGIQKFKPGFIFREGGGLEAVYNDRPEITEYTAEGRTVPVTRNVVLRPSTYTLGLAADYLRLLDEIRYYY